MDGLVRRLVEKAIGDSRAEREQAVNELAALGGQRALDGLVAAVCAGDARNVDTWRIRNAVIAFGEDARPVLRQALQSRPPEERGAVLIMLAEVSGGDAALALAALSSDPNVTVRRRALGPLSCVEGPRGADALAAYANDTDDGIRGEVAEMLCKRGDPRGVDLALAAICNMNVRQFNDWHSAVKGLRASFGFAGIGQDAAEKVLAAFEAADKEIRSRLDDLVGISGHPRAQEVLLDALRDAESEIEAAGIANALTQSGSAPSNPEDAVWYWMGLGRWEEAATWGTAAVAPMTTALRRWAHSKARVRFKDELPDALARIGGAQVIGHLREAMLSEPWVAEQCLRAIANILENSASQVSVEDLDAIAAMRARTVDGLREVPANTGDCDWETIPYRLDCGPIAELARDELHRRGLPVPRRRWLLWKV
ncbi:hypothetical protein LLH23_23825 [bacterium]|nr:hypothetical protein [bacterium]